MVYYLALRLTLKALGVRKYSRSSKIINPKIIMIMEKDLVYQMTNDFGRNYLQAWHKSDEFLGVEIPTENSRKEFYLVYKYSGGDIAVAVLPLAESTNNGCCSYGDLEYFAMSFAGEETNVNLRLLPNGNLYWPWWYVSEDEYNRWHKFYKEIKRKYS